MMTRLILLFCACSCFNLIAQERTIQQVSKKELDSLSNKLELLLKKDQTFRLIYLDAEKRFGNDSFEMDYFWNVVEEQDKRLEAELIDILNHYGWLGISQVGRLANTAQWAILQHGSLASKNKYAPLLKSSVLQQESNPRHYARLVDRMLINSEKAQLYGTQYEADSLGQLVFFPISNIDSINDRRKELQLQPIETFAKTKNIQWPIIEKL